VGSRGERPDLDLGRWLVFEEGGEEHQDWSKRRVDQVESEARRRGARQDQVQEVLCTCFGLNLNCLIFLDKIFMARKRCPNIGTID
jgi:hypothetical protein